MKELKKARMGMIAVSVVMLESVARRLMGTRRLPSGGLTLVVVGMVLLVAAGGASALPACPAPGNTVITTSCELDQDWDIPAGQHGYIIGADNIVIDGNGYYISGSTAGDVCFTDEGKQPAGIYNYNATRMYGYSNVMIENLEVKNFCTGILVRGATATKKVEDNTILRCNIHDNGDPAEDMNTFGIHFFKHVYDSTIDECEIHHNTDGASSGMACDSGGMGIRLKVNCNHNDIIENYIHDNVHSGIFTKGGCMFDRVAYNNVTGNGLSATSAPCGGITMRCKNTNNWTVEMNNITDNFGPGMYVGGSYNTIRYNTVMDCKDVAGGDLPSGYAIEVGRSDGGGINNELYTNTFCNNNAGVVDISACVSGSCTGNIGDDNTCDTTSNYNDDGTTGCTYDCEYSEVGCVAEDGTVFRCGDIVTKSCTLNGDINCSMTRYGLIIGADNITIDGAGYALERAYPGECALCPSAGILNKGYDDVAITNLEIKHFCNGIYLNRNIEGGNVVYRNIIENCNIHHNGNATFPSATHGITMKYVFNSTIQNNRIHHTIAHIEPNPGCEDGGNGIFLYKSDYNLITQNKFYNNTKGGLLMKACPIYNNISHNELWGNGQGGIILRCKLTDNNLVEHNNISNNYGTGIFIGGNNNTIRYNIVCNNKNGGPYHADSIGGHGFGVNIGRSDGSCYNKLYDNAICGNDFKDIYVVSGVTGNIGDENACDTTRNYNDNGTTNCTYSCGSQTSEGDLNGDDVITPADAVIALEMAVRGEYSEDADVSGDSMVTSLDALMIMQWAAGL